MKVRHWESQSGRPMDFEREAWTAGKTGRGMETQRGLDLGRPMGFERVACSGGKMERGMVSPMDS